MVKFMLSTLLGARRMSQAALSRKTGIRPSTINSYYHDYAKRVKLEYLGSICEALDCDLSDLIVYVSDDKTK